MKNHGDQSASSNHHEQKSKAPRVGLLEKKDQIAVQGDRHKADLAVRDQENVRPRGIDVQRPPNALRILQRLVYKPHLHNHHLTSKCYSYGQMND